MEISLELGKLMEAITSNEPPFSTWDVTSPVVPIAVIVGLSSLSKFKVIS